ncbi:hypothetical protein MYCTH_2129017 [Thermothelomyces thermophilus ATCC 42464]|uniref:Uncharacterized protein n=1 Tax=Thermothelomyces thermophilus (strain ATCC 42464 / BCRC 31852 / DSM 1799) TaxID=573729 RepID=G2QK14_THET4|nr:uncharacterized protein MYCTH_2129017 [Thermothelomyces thermophilus ATCC 42464]AEO59920.1 hypothetical protein MYCTH_2129017 [Thermothelomyces thermophilus ATCC 42464]
MGTPSGAESGESRRRTEAFGECRGGASPTYINYALAISDDIPEEYRANYEQFRDALSSLFIERIAAPFSKPKRRPSTRPCPGRGLRDLWARLGPPDVHHHLIPRMVYDKAVKRGWHRRDELQDFRGHEELAREYYTVERLLATDEVRRFGEWVGRVRWKAR